MKQYLLGVIAAVAVVLAFGALRRADPASLAVVADNGGKMTAIALHFDPRVVAEISETYEDLLRELPADVHVHVLVEKAADFASFKVLLAQWRIAATDRFRAIVVGKRITTWSRDRYTLANDHGRPVLLVPPRPTEGNPARRNDWDAPFALARSVSGAKTKIVDLMFEGGDFTTTATHIFATALLSERNQGGDLYDRDKLLAWLSQHTGKVPVLLGDSLADVPEHHIGMFVTPLDGRRIFVGDPDLGIALFDASHSDPSQLPQAIDRRDPTLQKFRNIANELKAQGFEVIGLPLVPLSDGLTYVTYNNVLLEHLGGKLHVYLPQFGILALDRAGAEAYAVAGVVVHPIRVKNIYRYNGTVHCLVNIVTRGPDSPTS